MFIFDNDDGVDDIVDDIRMTFLARAEKVDVGEWHAQDVRGNPALVSYELRDTIFRVWIDPRIEQLQRWIKPNLPWAEDHFLERVSGKPLNPAPSERWWPFAVNANASHKDGEKFSHTYPERMWPKFANFPGVRSNGREVYVPHNGLRYEYGDLNDLLNLLRRNPLTRQAYLPIWFPEDTGAVDGQRVPCTLGYHFLIRDGRLHCSYYIRSCDFVRHFRDDVYMAGRLMQWICEQLSSVLRPGNLTMYIASFHFFEGDRETMKRGV